MRRRTAPYISLVINADDLGLANGVNAAVAELLADCCISSTTIMPCVPWGLEQVIALAQENDGHIGVHLQLTQGEPCASPDYLPSLVQPETGRFPDSPAALTGVSPAEVKREWALQMEKVSSLGIRPTHIDSHHNVHELDGVFPVYCEIAALFGVPARATTPAQRDALRAKGIACTDYCIAHWSGRDVSRAKLIDSVRAIADSHAGATSVEIVCHPAYVTTELRARSIYVDERDRERGVLQDPSLADALGELGAELVTYATGIHGGTR